MTKPAWALAGLIVGLNIAERQWASLAIFLVVVLLLWMASSGLGRFWHR